MKLNTIRATNLPFCDRFGSRFTTAYTNVYYAGMRVTQHVAPVGSAHLQQQKDDTARYSIA